MHSLSNLEDNRLSATPVRNSNLTQSDFTIYPNPYKNSTTIRYELKTSSELSIKVFNPLGQLIGVVDSGTKPAGIYEKTFSATDFGGRSGMYFLKFIIDGTLVKTTKLIEE